MLTVHRCANLWCLCCIHFVLHWFVGREFVSSQLFASSFFTFHLCVFLRKFHAARRDSHWPISKFPGVLPLSPALSSISQDYRQPVARKSHSPCFFGEQLVSRSLLYINCRYHISTTIQAFRTKPKQESSSIQLSHG